MARISVKWNRERERELAKDRQRASGGDKKSDAARSSGSVPSKRAEPIKRNKDKGEAVTKLAKTAHVSRYKIEQAGASLQFLIL